jgi:hypothetical protein
MLMPRHAGIIGVLRQSCQATRSAAGTAWMLMLIVLAIKETEDHSRARSAVVAVPATLANATVEYVFIR